MEAWVPALMPMPMVLMVSKHDPRLMGREKMRRTAIANADDIEGNKL